MIGIFPQEIWIQCVTIACLGKEYKERLLNLLLVSSSWFNALLDCPLLWAKIPIDSTSEDLLATISLFLSLSGSSTLSLDITVPFVAWEPIAAILAPHKHRVKEIILRPSQSEHLFTNKNFSYTLDYFLQVLGPFPSLRSIDVATRRPIKLSRNWSYPPTLISTGNWVVPSSAIRRLPRHISGQRGLIVRASELIDAGPSLSAMESLDNLYVYSTEHEYVQSNTVPIGDVNFTMPQLKALRYQGQMHWVSEKLLLSVGNTIQHLEFQISVQDLHYTVRCLGTIHALRSLVLRILALDSVLESMSRRAEPMSQSVANWKTRITHSSNYTIGHSRFKCRILDVNNEIHDENLWTAFHHAFPPIISLLQKLPLESAALGFFILSQQDLDSRPDDGVLSLVPEGIWETAASKTSKDETEVIAAETIIADIMYSTHLAGPGHVSDYSIYAIPSNSEGALRFHWGEPIPILWRAPLDHSHKDWVGIYKDGANPHKITRILSFGLWIPLNADHWDGDFTLPEHPMKESEMSECGEISFKGFTLPWETGHYEIRYHVAGTCQMVAEIRRVEIYLDRPKRRDSESIWRWLLRIVCLALDSDPDLIPRSALSIGDPGSPSHDLSDDDFRFWTNENGKPSMRQPTRIAYAIEEALEIRLSAEEILQKPNVSLLTQRILSMMFSPRSRPSPRRRRSRSASPDRMTSQNIFR
ncbi:hypothetical protein M408DRAFT_30720 [Serendipita vermifera MAFF 305830]|uniref:Uncharacterized protein n=1 Tax=Serendipita vermifera MAFF 305830 TaxID=933852 RepID=A0A0C2W0I3_SERVB|nr:hypothetical protein M408DRAFT_30720 [Serendipita vermifera MAFF 305830]